MAWRKAIEIKRQDLCQVPQEWIIESLPSPSQQPGVHVLVRVATNLAETQILDQGAAEILEALRCGEVSAQEVVEAFAHRAFVAHQYTTCLCENNFATARAHARELDSYWRAHHAPIGPLHGLCISVMDRFHVANLDSACGFASWVGKKRTADDEGTLVRTLRSLGALILCKTNVPMSMLLGETANNIIGTTVNPFNRQLSAGGACGGEGALISLRGSHLGLGTDIAGSSRISGAFCGLYALKCSEGRLPHDGIATILPGLPVASGAIGLISNERAILTTALKALLDSPLALHDPDVIEIPWRQERFDLLLRRKGSTAMGSGRLVFGVMSCDGHVQPHPPIQRAIALLASALQEAGHEVIDWNPPSHAPATDILFKILGSTSAIEARKALNASGEPPIPQIAEWYENEDIEPNTTAEFWALCEQRRQYCTQYKAYWNSVGNLTRTGRSPDGVILPVAPTLAVRPGEFHYYGYSAIANVLDYPSGVFPVAFGDKNLDKPAEYVELLSDMDKIVRNTYRPEDAHGMPIALQVMCPRLHEENVLCLMDAIAESLSHSKQRINAADSVASVQ